jgi:hypothetical protein
MVERTLIFNAEGFRLGYIEGCAAFDLNGTQRCSYAGATGILCDLKNGNIVGHVSLDGTFVGASWVSDELFGKPNGDVETDHLARMRSAHRDSRKASVYRPEKWGDRNYSAATIGCCACARNLWGRSENLEYFSRGRHA